MLSFWDNLGCNAHETHTLRNHMAKAVPVLLKKKPHLLLQVKSMI